ncbi:MAG: RNA polymerase subunit sigma [Planctomycetales bacterium]|nr:RNA polymerase subunit sigma [Planctomycetales bacterium]
MAEFTQIIRDIERGDLARTDELLPLVYQELRALASAKLAHEPPGHSLQATALVHEAYMRLIGRDRQQPSTDLAGGASGGVGHDQDTYEATETAPGWQGRGHFFAAAAEAMRRILIENARRRGRIKRGGDRTRVPLDDHDVAVVSPVSDDLIALDESLKRLERRDPVKAQVVKLRHFAGLTIDETSLALGISAPTVKRHWFYARAWLRRDMLGGETGEIGSENSQEE